MHSMNFGTNQVNLAKAIAIESSRFIHIPGPNPILRYGKIGQWDDDVIEACDILKDHGKYYLYYHAQGDSAKGYNKYNIGVAVADHPLGPFKKYDGNPLFEHGSKGSYDDGNIACAFVMKEVDTKSYPDNWEGTDKYYMWYFGMRAGTKKSFLCLATASSPLGPWKKHEANPLLEDLGYVGSVIKINGEYRVYAEHPIGVHHANHPNAIYGPDYGPISVAVAKQPEGPYQLNLEPVLRPGDWGQWDDGGISESEVLYHNELFHIFYAGAKSLKPRPASLESLGYAYSVDGYKFYKYGRNPVIEQSQVPNMASMGEAHTLIEPPFIYVYHTLRYVEPPTPEEAKRFPSHLEDVGVQILVTQKPYRLNMPIFHDMTLEAGQTTKLKDTFPLGLSQVDYLSLCVEAEYSANATEGLKIHIRASQDGSNFDTEDLHCLELPCKAGDRVQKTFVGLNAQIRFNKLLIENLDNKCEALHVNISAVLCG